MSMTCHCSPPEKPYRPRVAGFTIIETLVVLAVLSVLLAVLLPAVRCSEQRPACRGRWSDASVAYRAFALHDEP